MGITVEQECPQCGGPIELDEVDHILQCPYCGVRNFLFTPNYFRFMLPHKAPGQEIIYVPYLRFKGNVYYCEDLTIGHRFVDITRAGLMVEGIPSSLGLRPQALKMKFLTADTAGSFLKFSLKAIDIVEKAARLSSAAASGHISHRAFIGETLSLIYLPLYIQGNRLFDAILNRPIADLPPGREVFKSDTVNKIKWKPSFLPTMCPDCGWNLAGEKDSVVLICDNCKSAWEATKEKFEKVDLWTVPGNTPKTDYLPFWEIYATASGVKINSFADFIRVTNQPLVIKREWENMDMRFCTPAFKIRPKVFLRLTSQTTISRRNFQTKKVFPGKKRYPVTLPRTEAEQAMKLTLASSAINKRNIFPNLSGINFHIKNTSLVYLPFSDTGHEMALQNTRISINKNALEFGRKL